jgi:sugar diacid utilization regulator
VRLADLLDMPGHDLLTLVVPTAPGPALGREVRTVYTTDLPEPGYFLDGGELVLTSATWYRRPADAEVYVAALAGAGSAGLVVGTACVGHLPAPLREACERHGLPLLVTGDEVSFATITETVLAALAGDGGRTPGAALHRRLLASMAAGAGAAGLVDLLVRATGVGCAVLSATGRRTAGQLPGIPDARLATAYRTALAGSFPSVQSLPGGRQVSYHPIQSPAPRRPPAAYLAMEGDPRDWPPGVADAVDEVCALLAMERATRSESRRTEERLLREALELLRTGRIPDADRHLRSLGLDLRTPIAGVVVSAHHTRYGAELAAVVLDDIAEEIPGSSTPIAQDDAYLLLLAGHDRSARQLADRVRGAVSRLSPLLTNGWVTAGIGLPAVGAAHLRTSLEEAHHAHRLAGIGEGGVRIATGEDLSSHLLLMASVPDDVRRVFRDRLLGVLETYDAQHGSNLIDTLTAFLRASGSWIRCAEELQIHVSTLRYRLSRVEQLTGHNLATFSDRVDFWLALTLR